MSKIKLVVEIDKDYYEIIKNEVEKANGTGYKPFVIIANGTPLPKGHGRLIDADRLEKPMEFACMGVMAGTDAYNEPLKVIERAPTIVEADNETDD